jgi:hypothetical protein
VKWEPVQRRTLRLRIKMTIKKESTVFYNMKPDYAKPGDLAIEYKALDTAYRYKEKIYIISLRTSTAWIEVEFWYPEFGKEALMDWGIDLDCLQTMRNEVSQ